jgi:hypothetical protein
LLRLEPMVLVVGGRFVDFCGIADVVERAGDGIRADATGIEAHNGLPPGKVNAAIIDAAERSCRLLDVRNATGASHPFNIKLQFGHGE